MKTSKYELDENIQYLIQDLRILKVVNPEQYDYVLNDIRKDLGDEFFQKYFHSLLE